MAKRKTTVPPDEQDLENVGTEVLPPAEDSGLAGEGSPDGDAAQEDALLEESDLSRADSPPSGEAKARAMRPRPALWLPAMRTLPARAEASPRRAALVEPTESV